MSYLAEVAADAPIAWWQFDSADPYTDSVAGAVFVEGAPGGISYPLLPGLGIERAIDFDGTAAGLNPFGSGFSPIAGDFSVEWWLYPRSLPAGVGVVGNELGPGGDEFYFVTDENGSAYIGTGFNDPAKAFDPADIPNGTFVLNQWRHIVFTHEAASGLDEVFINGVLLVDAIHVGADTGWFHSYVALAGTAVAADAQYAQLAFYDYPLAAARVAAHYSAGLGGAISYIDLRGEKDSFTLIAGNARLGLDRFFAGAASLNFSAPMAELLIGVAVAVDPQSTGIVFAPASPALSGDIGFEGAASLSLAASTADLTMDSLLDPEPAVISFAGSEANLSAARPLLPDSSEATIKFRSRAELNALLLEGGAAISFSPASPELRLSAALAGDALPAISFVASAAGITMGGAAIEGAASLSLAAQPAAMTAAVAMAGSASISFGNSLPLLDGGGGATGAWWFRDKIMQS